MKGNQPGLHVQLRTLPWQDVPAGHVSDSWAHGRIEKRIVKVVTVAAGLAFPHAAQARPGLLDGVPAGTGLDLTLPVNPTINDL